MGIKCPKCHFENPDDTAYCGKCATLLQSSEEVSVTKTFITPTKGLDKGGTIAGKYRIIEKLGEGGMGVVYKAEDTRLKRTVALKFMPTEMTRDPEAKERFVREAQAVAALAHPNICTIHEIDEEEGTSFIAMEYIEGQSIREKIKKGPLDLTEALNIGIQAAQGLEEAHKKGIIHRDIKSANIMVTEKGQAKIMDFGLAKVIGASLITKEAKTMGTVAYMSPEQARGEELDERTDIWSLGVILYEMISGNLPFRGANDQSIVFSILNEDPRPVKELPNGIPLELDNIIRKALAKDPAKRFASGKEMSEALEELKSKLFFETYPITKHLLYRKPFKRMLIGTAAGIVVISAILVIWMSMRPGLAFESRDKLLVADVDNQTDEAVFDLALRTAIEADLQQSPFARIFDKNEASETLRLMRKDPASRIDEELGLDICRFAGVRVLIFPRILSAGEAYELQAILIDPVKRRHVRRIRVTALGKEEVLLHAIDDLARKVRSHLGESIGSIEKTDEPVVKVTTSSWEALQYLAMGQERRRAGQFKEAAKLLELAIEKDPKFASAKGSLGLVLIQFLDQKEKGQEMLREALQDAEGLPQQEYLMIKAVNKWYVDEDFNGALEEYRLVRDLYPDLWTAYNNPGVILRELGQFDEAITMFEKAAELAPRASTPLANLWFTHLNYKKNPSAAEEIGKRLIELGPEIAYCHHFYGYSLAAQAKYEEALEAYRKTIEIDPKHPYGRPNLAHLLLATGRAEDAIPHYREVRVLVSQGQIHGTYVSSSLDLAIAMTYAGDQETAGKVVAEGREEHIKTIEKSPPNADLFLIIALLDVVGGDTDEAEQYVGKAREVGISDPYSTMNLAEYYALLGEKELAIETVRKALDMGYSDPYFPLILPAFQSIRFEPEFRTLFGINTDFPEL